jgi:hypothetical protein
VGVSEASHSLAPRPSPLAPQPRFALRVLHSLPVRVRPTEGAARGPLPGPCAEHVWTGQLLSGTPGHARRSLLTKGGALGYGRRPIFQNRSGTKRYQKTGDTAACNSQHGTCAESAGSAAYLCRLRRAGSTGLSTTWPRWRAASAACAGSMRWRSSVCTSRSRGTLDPKAGHRSACCHQRRTRSHEENEMEVRREHEQL